MPSAQEDLFTGNANRLARFREVRDYLSSLGGNVTVRPAKTQVAFRGKRRQFAWVWLPQPWDKRRHPDSIVVSFALDHEVRDGRIAQAVEPRPGRWMHHVVVLGAEELEQQVKEWLREAHGQGMAARGAPASFQSIIAIGAGVMQTAWASRMPSSVPSRGPTISMRLASAALRR